MVSLHDGLNQGMQLVERCADIDLLGLLLSLSVFYMLIHSGTLGAYAVWMLALT